MEKLADLHIHTNRGDEILSVSEVVAQAKRLDLAAVAITDHDQIGPKMEVEGIEIVRGVEVTAKGYRHVLGLFVEGEVPFGLSVSQTVAEIHRQGGLAIAAHPFIPFWPASLTEEDIWQVDINPDFQVYWDGFEIGGFARKKAEKFYETNLRSRVAKVGGSDEHFRAIGRVVTVYEGDLREAIKQQKTRVIVTGIKDELFPGDLGRNFIRSTIYEPRRRKRWRF